MKNYIRYLLIAFLLLSPIGQAGEKALPWEQRKADEEFRKTIVEAARRKREKDQAQGTPQQRNRAAFVAGAVVADASNRGWFRKAWLWIVGAAGAVWALLRGKKGSKNRG